MQKPASSYWFPAKRYGWGWGLPNTWQGWAVLATFAALLTLSALAFPPRASPLAFTGAVIVLCVVFSAVCFAKGEPTRWRWGE